MLQEALVIKSFQFIFCVCFNQTLSTGDIAFRIAKNIELFNKKNQINADEAKQSGVLISDINEVNLPYSFEMSFCRIFFIYSCLVLLIKAMLEVGKKRALELNLSCPEILSWLCADAQELPLEDNRFDVYTIAFGIRNVVDIQKVSVFIICNMIEF